MQGKTLNVLGRIRRHGTLYLTLTLPDGGSSLIPAAWTDLAIGLTGLPSAKQVNRIHGSLQDLIRTRTVVDALLRRHLDSLEKCPGEEEGSHAAGAVSHTFGAEEKTSNLGESKPGSAGSSRHGSRQVDDEKRSPDTKEGQR